jgi:hypothetical protein
MEEIYAYLTNVKTGGTVKHILKNIYSVPYNIKSFTNFH